MSNQAKTHYRKVFKSDHLGCADLEDFIENGSDMIFTIKEVRQQQGARVAGKKIDANIAYFENKNGKPIKPMVLNSTNCGTMKNLTGSTFVEDWKGVTVLLFIDKNVKLMSQIVGGIRISPKKLNAPKAMLTRANVAVWNNVIVAFKKYGNFNKVLEKWTMTQEDIKFISEGVSNGSL